MTDLRPLVSYLPDCTVSNRTCGLTSKNSSTSIIPYSNSFGSWIHVVWKVSSGSKRYCRSWTSPEFLIQFSSNFNWEIYLKIYLNLSNSGVQTMRDQIKREIFILWEDGKEKFDLLVHVFLNDPLHQISGVITEMSLFFMV